MFHFACSYAESKRSKRPVGGSMAVSAHYGHPWLCKTEFGTDHMNYALEMVVYSYSEKRYSEILAVLSESFYLLCGYGIRNGFASVCGRDVMVHRGESKLGPSYSPPRDS